MIAYFTASIAGKKKYLGSYLEIIAYLKNKGCQVISDHIINSTEKQIILEKKEDRFKFHGQLKKWISSCDLVVAETSFPSTSVGYEISLARQYGKPILILYQGRPPSLMASSKDGKTICEQYAPASFSHLIDAFLSSVRDTIDIRFNFFITAEIASYLEKISRREKIPKSVYLRKLIEQAMKMRNASL